MKARSTHPEQQLLHDVVLDEALRGRVRATCVRELRTRAPAESMLLDEILGESEGAADPGEFLQLVRDECLATVSLSPPSRFRSRVLQAAAVFLALACAWLLARPPEEPIAAPPPPSVPPAVRVAPDYIVTSQPVADGIVVRTRDHAAAIPRIGDEELIATFPELSVARTWDQNGNATVFVAHPAQGRLHRLN